MEDSYQDDEFEDTVVSMKSHEKTKLQQDLKEKQEKAQRQKQLNWSGNKMRASQKKDATPIKEEDIEEEVSAQEEDERFEQQKKLIESNGKRRRSTNFERDSQNDLEEDFMQIEEASKSHSTSVQIEDPSSASGNYVPSLVEKARNLVDKSRGAKQSDLSSVSPRHQQHEEADDDEYIDEEFEQLEESGS